MQTKQQFIKTLQAFGFQFNESNEYYLVSGKIGKKDGRIGVKVGEYVHSCHVDTTDILVLLFLNEDGNDYVEDVWDFGAKKI